MLAGLGRFGNASGAVVKGVECHTPSLQPVIVSQHGSVALEAQRDSSLESEVSKLLRLLKAQRE